MREDKRGELQLGVRNTLTFSILGYSCYNEGLASRNTGCSQCLESLQTFVKDLQRI